MIFRFFLFWAACLSAKDFRVITVEYSPSIGMFATANQVLGQIYLFETGRLKNVSGLAVDFRENGLYYDPSCGPNWWSYYFEPVCIGEKENARIVYPSRSQYWQSWMTRYEIPRSIASDIVRRHIHVKRSIQQKVDAFIDQFFQNRYVIGVHYRGLDKGKEAPRVDFAKVFEEIDRRIPQNRPYVIFIATDEGAFLESARQKYADLVLAIDAHRSIDLTKGVHFSYSHNYQVGEEAILDALLLSRCDFLIRTSSNLSLWATYFNPDLPVVLLNHRNQRTIEPE